MSRRAPLGHSGRPRLGTVPPRPRRTPPPARCPAQAATTGLGTADPARRPASVAQASPARYGEGADSRPAGHRTTPLSHHVNADTYRGRAGPRAPGWAPLHSQLDVGAHSQSVKIDGREPVRLHPDDAAARGLREGDLVRIFNDRGACLAGLAVDEAVRPGVAQLSTGAWYDPDPADPSFCLHGNPNVLTADLPSSSLSQGCTGQLALVEVEAYRETPPELSVTRPPALIAGK